MVYISKSGEVSKSPPIWNRIANFLVTIYAIVITFFWTLLGYSVNSIPSSSKLSGSDEDVSGRGNKGSPGVGPRNRGKGDESRWGRIRPPSESSFNTGCPAGGCCGG